MSHPTIVIRHATPGDGPALSRLAALDSAPVPFGTVLLAEVDGTLRAALHLDTALVIADPFARTVELVELLRVHAAAIGAERAAATPPGRRLRRREHAPRPSAVTAPPPGRGAWVALP